MACETMLKPQQTLLQRMEEVKRTLAKLEQRLTGGQVKVVIGANGAVSFAGWQDRDGVSDVCAYRALASGNSFALRRAIAAAEAMSGRRVNPQAIAAGIHSHDGGKSWSPGH